MLPCGRIARKQLPDATDLADNISRKLLTVEEPKVQSRETRRLVGEALGAVISQAIEQVFKPPFGIEVADKFGHLVYYLTVDPKGKKLSWAQENPDMAALNTAVFPLTAILTDASGHTIRREISHPPSEQLQ